jgi:nucleoside-diphosphate-sugar epimerase
MRVEGSKVVVTGGTGFLGTHLADELREAGAQVSALGSSDYDLRDRAEVHRMLETIDPDALVHLAAVVGGIGANRAEPGRFFYENALMGIEVLEACRLHGVSKVLVAGTVCSYPKFTAVPFHEEDLWTGYPEETNAPYGLAKKMLLVQTQAYRAQYDTNFVYVLPVNLYGPGDNYDLRSGHVIPALVRRFLEAQAGGVEEVKLWGDGSPTREFLYARDAARGFRLALEKYDGADPVNLGSGEEISISSLAALIADLTGYTGTIAWDSGEPNGQPRRRLDTSRARERFEFQARVPLREGLATTIAAYRDSIANVAARGA